MKLFSHARKAHVHATASSSWLYQSHLILRNFFYYPTTATQTGFHRELHPEKQRRIRTVEAVVTVAADSSFSPTMAAAEAVFSTVELLDMILLRVVEEDEVTGSHNYHATYRSDSLHEVFELQKVNKTFYYHINGKTGIAQALF